MGAALAGCAVPVPVDNQLRLDITQLDEDDIRRLYFVGKFTLLTQPVSWKILNL